MKYRNPKLTHAVLVRAGYKKWKSPYADAVALWQKKVFDNSGTKYYINIYEHDYGMLTNKKLDFIGFEPSVVFNNDNEDSVKVDYIMSDNSTIKKIEEFYNTIFKAMKFKYKN